MSAINSHQNSQNRAAQAKVTEQMQADIKAQTNVTEQMRSDIKQIAETAVNTDKTVNEIKNKIDITINNSNTAAGAARQSRPASMRVPEAGGRSHANHPPAYQ